MSNKKKVSISIDPNIWELAADKCPGSRSEFIENQLKLYMNYEEDPEAKLLNKIMKTKNELNVMEDRLCEIRKEKKLKLKSANIFDDAMVSLTRMYESQGHLGRNQIRNIAKVNDVPPLDLEKYCIDEGFDIVNFAEVPKK